MIDHTQKGKKYSAILFVGIFASGILFFIARKSHHLSDRVCYSLKQLIPMEWTFLAYAGMATYSTT